jgi:ABC-2 type transport system permease protein
MNWRRLRAVIRHEILELSRSRIIFLTMAIVPSVLVLVALLTEQAILATPDAAFRFEGTMPELLERYWAAGLEPKTAVLILLNEQFLTMLLIVATALPSTVASHAVIGEKVERTLEPLLATPVATVELLLGKTFVSIVPGVVFTWIAYGFTLAGFAYMSPPVVLASATRPVWPLAFAALAPLVACTSALTSIAVSSRVNDPRTAQGLAGFLVIPLLGMGISALLGAITIDVSWVVWGAALMAAIDAALLAIAVRLFSRETILTRWR